jgi:WD40 repeat protein
LWNNRGNPIGTSIGNILSAKFSPDGTTILIASKDWTARLWNIPMPLADFLNSDRIMPLANMPLSEVQNKNYGID